MTVPAAGFPPLLFSPIYKDKIWGGRALEKLGKTLPANAAIGESWELSGHGKDISIVAKGEYAGQNLAELLIQDREGLLGTQSRSDIFPLLYKFIDAHDKLSIQVHPTDEQAATYDWDRAGKTECWYIAGAKPGAKIIVGVKPGVSAEMIEEAVRNQALSDLMNSIDITAGDLLFIPAGTVHAILDGTLLYEVQETSDVTFRLYDWGRVDASGQPRDLHLAESLLVLDTSAHNQHKIDPVLIRKTSAYEYRVRIACRYFAIDEYLFSGQATAAVPHRNSFQVITLMSGSARIIFPQGVRPINSGETVLLPASLPSMQLDADGPAHALVSWVPNIKTDIITPLRTIGIDDSRIARLGGYEKFNDIMPLLK